MTFLLVSRVVESCDWYKAASRSVIAGLALFVGTSPAAAHGLFNLPPGLMAGLSHPVSVPAHVLPLAAIALLTGQQGMARIRQPLIACGVGLAAGLAASFIPLPAEMLQWVLLAIAMVTGVPVLLALPVANAPLMAIAAIAGAAIGSDSGIATDSWLATILTLAGTLIAVLLLYLYLAAVTAVIHTNQPPWMRIGVRVAGSWITAIAALILSLQLIV